MFTRTLFVAAVAAVALVPGAPAADPFADTVKTANKKLVKIFGAGGFARLNNYGTGILVSKDGHILTVASQILDTSDLVVHTYDGQRLNAQVLATEPELDAALIKIRLDGKKIDEPNGLDLDYFDFFEAAKRPPAEAGDWVLALSNTFEIALRDEPLSVQRGVVSAYTKMAGRRGVFEFPYTGDVYVVDAITNGPGAGGGPLTNRKGELLGLIGREIKNSQTETWINYAIPVFAEVTVKDEKNQDVQVSIPKFVDLAMQGKYKTIVKPKQNRTAGGFVGVKFVPNVLDRTPPYIDEVIPDSPAAKAGIQVNDLVSFIDGEPIYSIKSYLDVMGRTRPNDTVRMEVRRGDSLISVELKLGEWPKGLLKPTVEPTPDKKPGDK